MLLGQLDSFAENVGPVAARRNEHSGFYISLDQTTRGGNLLRRGSFKKEFELERIDKLNFVQWRETDRFALNLGDDLGAVGPGSTI